MQDENCFKSKLLYFYRFEIVIIAQEMNTDKVDEGK